MGLPRDKKLVKKSQEHTCYLKAAELLAHETASLQHMATAPWPPNLSWWKGTLLAASRQAKNAGTLDAHVWFEARDPRSGAQEPPFFIELGAKIVVSTNPIVTYFFAVGTSAGQDSSRRGLRKFHFDLDVIPSASEPKPAMHMQLAGRTPACLARHYAENAFDHLHPQLDKPRLPCLPKSFALLAHLALLEYHVTDDRLSAFLHDPHWISVVKASELALLRPHFEYCRAWLSRAENRSLLSQFYGL